MLDLMGYMHRIGQSESAYTPEFRYLIDARNAVATNEPAARDRSDLDSSLAAMELPPAPIKCATILPLERLEYGLSRMYAVQMDQSPIDYQIFESVQDALVWLEVDDRVIPELSESTTTLVG